MLNFFKATPEVATAIHDGRPVVALESTVISHGLPYPFNLETARAMEDAVRQAGATPATIAVWPETIKIGLTDTELEVFAAQKEARKLSSRDLASALTDKIYGSTTVAATTVCAHHAGIRFFATGGIGGVHRDASRSGDISADLHQVAKTPVAIICSGAKAILDLPKTLEYLETLGVPVVGYGRNELPNFYSRESGLLLDQCVADATGAAAVARRHWSIDNQGGLLFTNPVPAHAAMDRTVIEQLVGRALAIAEREHIVGKAVTPFLLKQLAVLSNGATLRANRVLLLENARVAADIAVAYFTRS